MKNNKNRFWRTIDIIYIGLYLRIYFLPVVRAGTIMEIFNLTFQTVQPIIERDLYEKIL